MTYATDQVALAFLAPPDLSEADKARLSAALRHAPRRPPCPETDAVARYSSRWERVAEGEAVRS